MWFRNFHFRWLIACRSWSALFTIPYLISDLHIYLCRNSEKEEHVLGGLTLDMLNKLRCRAHFLFSANQITWSRLLIYSLILNGKQCRSRLVGFFRSQLIWIYTVCKCRIYSGLAGQGLRLTVTLHFVNCLRFSKRRFCNIIRAGPQHFLQYCVYVQRRLRPACADHPSLIRVFSIHLNTL